MFLGFSWQVSTRGTISITLWSTQSHCWLFSYQNCRSLMASDCLASMPTDWDTC